MLCRLFFQIYIKNKTEITEIDIAEGYQRADNQKLKLILLKLTSLKDIKEQIIKIKLILLKLTSLNLKFNSKNKSATELKRGREATY